jgi:drug/metabolite transporter (DMT)-like permease
VTPSSALAIGLALVSVLCYAAGAALQRRESGRAATEEGHGASGVPFFRALVRRGWWWIGIVATTLGAAVHVGALRLGSVTLVQPIGVTTLIVALPLDARLEHRRVRGAEWAAAAVLVAGLAGVVVLAPHHARPVVPDGLSVVITTATAAGVVLALAAASATVGARVRAVLRGGAAGVCAGATSGLVRLFFLLLGGPSPSGVAVGFTLGAIAVLPVVGILLLQTAYRDGGLDPGLATQTAVDPTVASAIGIAVLGERFTAGVLGGTGAVLCALVTVGALVALVRVSPDATIGPAPVTDPRGTGGRTAARAASGRGDAAERPNALGRARLRGRPAGDSGQRPDRPG